jgi:hypothetical protein
MALKIAVVISSWVLLAAFITLVSIILTRRRAMSWRSIARRAGFEYCASATPFEGTDIGGLTVLEGDSSCVVTNLLQGMVRGCYTFLFDLSICNPSSEIITTTTIAAFRYPHGRLPVLQIATRNLLDRLGEVLAHTRCLDIDPEFSRHFVVHCVNEGETRVFLTPEKVRQLCLHADHFRIESSSDWLLVYRTGVSVKRQDLPDFAKAAVMVACILLPPEPMELPISA